MPNIKVNKPMTVNVTTMRIHLKVRDEFIADFTDSSGKVVHYYEGYVPSFMPGQHYGDYVILDIDLETGKILNWEAVTDRAFQQFYDNNTEQE